MTGNIKCFYDEETKLISHVEFYNSEMICNGNLIMNQRGIDYYDTLNIKPRNFLRTKYYIIDLVNKITIDNGSIGTTELKTTKTEGESTFDLRVTEEVIERIEDTGPNTKIKLIKYTYEDGIVTKQSIDLLKNTYKISLIYLDTTNTNNITSVVEFKKEFNNIESFSLDDTLNELMKIEDNMDYEHFDVYSFEDDFKNIMFNDKLIADDVANNQVICTEINKVSTYKYKLIQYNTMDEVDIVGIFNLMHNADPTILTIDECESIIDKNVVKNAFINNGNNFNNNQIKISMDLIEKYEESDGHLIIQLKS